MKLIVGFTFDIKGFNLKMKKSAGLFLLFPEFLISLEKFFLDDNKNN
jgi:hypothetical protein